MNNTKRSVLNIFISRAAYINNKMVIWECETRIKISVSSISNCLQNTAFLLIEELATMGRILLQGWGSQITLNRKEPIRSFRQILLSKEKRYNFSSNVNCSTRNTISTLTYTSFKYKYSSLSTNWTEESTCKFTIFSKIPRN